MKKIWIAVVSILFVALLILPFTGQNSAVAATKLPTFNKKSITLTGVDSTYELIVKNKPQNVVLKWSSSKDSVATVNGLGVVTAKKKGTTTITCAVTYPDKSYVKLTSKVTVKIPATGVIINNGKLENNAHVMLVGDTYDFNRTLVPKGSSDKTYWEIKDPDIATVDSNGVVKAVKPGVTQLVARTGANKTAALDPLNEVTDAINIYIKSPISSVDSVLLTGDREVTIKFTHPMLASSLIVGNALNVSNITVEAKTVSGVKAADLGNIVPNLSTDGKVLTLSTTNKWDGVYQIKIENDITSQTGIAFSGYDEDLDFSDKITPALERVTVDDTGFIALIKFNKEVNIANLVVSVTDPSLNALTKTVVTTTSNYVLQSDNKTIQLDLSKIAAVDYNKSFKIYMTGITDTKGNPTTPYVNEFYVNTDTSIKPNANLIRVERTGKSTFTAYFDRSIQYGGYMILNNYSAGGVVSTTDKKSVVYKFDASLVNTTGYLTGTLSSWMSYNSSTTGASTTFSVDMSVGLTLPVITKHEMVSTLNGNTLVHSIVLTYNKDVTLTNKMGSLITKFIDAQNNVNTYYMLYTATVDKNIVKIMIDPTSLLGAGNYTVTIPAYFVYDSYTNFSEETVITAANNTISSIKLPAPTKILQDENDPSVVYVNYGTKVDMATAGAISSYRIDGKYPVSADVQTNSASGAVVKLTFASGTIPFTGTLPFYVQNVKGDNGAYQTMDNYFVMKEFKENVRPVLLSATITGTTITLKFSEKIQGVASFTVKNYGTEVSLNSSKPYYILEDTIMISLAQTVLGNTVSVQPSVGCIIKDLAGNPVIMADSMPVTVY